MNWKKERIYQLIDFFCIRFHCVLLVCVTSQGLSVLWPYFWCMMMMQEEEMQRKKRTMKRIPKLGKYISFGGVIKECGSCHDGRSFHACSRRVVDTWNVQIHAKVTNIAAIKRYLGPVLCKRRQWNSYCIKYIERKLRLKCISHNKWLTSKAVAHKRAVIMKCIGNAVRMKDSKCLVASLHLCTVPR